MEFRQRAQHAAKHLFGILQASPSTELEAQVVKVIEQTMIDTLLEEGERCTKVAMQCCSADKDLAHKIAERIQQTQAALIVNLSSMR
jgi:adenylyl- and sulfurtransferase ThiI